MTEKDRRSPYVVLGIPFGASEKDARSGFAKAKRRLRRDPAQPFTQEDLTWALHQVEQIILKPELAFEVYRIPAVARSDASGVFNPLPHRTQRVTEPATNDDWEQLKRVAIANALTQALAEDFPDRPRVIPYQTD